MKIYKSQKEFEADIKDGVFVSNESIDITNFNLRVDASINVSWDIYARDINVGHIKAGDIYARNINAKNINAWDVSALDINAWNINVRNINAGDINTWDIYAKRVKYYGVAFAHKNIRVQSIKGTRNNSRHFVLDGVIEIELKD